MFQKIVVLCVLLLSMTTKSFSDILNQNIIIEDETGQESIRISSFGDDDYILGMVHIYIPKKIGDQIMMKVGKLVKAEKDKIKKQSISKRGELFYVDLSDISIFCEDENLTKVVELECLIGKNCKPITWDFEKNTSDSNYLYRYTLWRENVSSNKKSVVTQMFELVQKKDFKKLIRLDKAQLRNDCFEFFTFLTTKEADVYFSSLDIFAATVKLPFEMIVTSLLAESESDIIVSTSYRMIENQNIFLSTTEKGDLIFLQEIPSDWAESFIDYADKLFKKNKQNKKCKRLIEKIGDYFMFKKEDDWLFGVDKKEKSVLWKIKKEGYRWYENSIWYSEEDGMYLLRCKVFEDDGKNPKRSRLGEKINKLQKRDWGSINVDEDIFFKKTGKVLDLFNSVEKLKKHEHLNECNMGGIEAFFNQYLESVISSIPEDK